MAKKYVGVELLAEGIIHLTDSDEVYIDFKQGFGKTYINDYFCTYSGKNVKIYIEVVK